MGWGIDSRILLDTVVQSAVRLPQRLGRGFPSLVVLVFMYTHGDGGGNRTRDGVWYVVMWYIKLPFIYSCLLVFRHVLCSTPGSVLFRAFPADSHQYLLPFQGTNLKRVLLSLATNHSKRCRQSESAVTCRHPAAPARFPPNRCFHSRPNLNSAVVACRQLSFVLILFK